MDCDIRKMLQRQFYYFGTYFLEEGALASWSAQARDAEVVFDIGANAGIYSLAAAASNPMATIHAFEPTPEIAAHLERTINLNCLNTRIHIQRYAVAQETGTAHLNYLSGNDANEGMNFVTHEFKNSKSVLVPTITLDDFCELHRIRKVDLIKIDVEGNEAQVLAGAEGLIRDGSLKMIFFELNWNHDTPNDCPASKCVAILQAAGYHFADPNGKMSFHTAGSWLKGLTNVAASHPRRAG